MVATPIASFPSGLYLNIPGEEDLIKWDFDKVVNMTGVVIGVEDCVGYIGPVDVSIQSVAGDKWMQVHAPTSLVDDMAKDQYVHWRGGKRIHKMDMRFKAAQAAVGTTGTFAIVSPLRPLALTCTETLAPDPEPPVPVLSECVFPRGDRADLDENPLAMNAPLRPIQLFVGYGQGIVDFIFESYFDQEEDLPRDHVVVLKDNCDLQDAVDAFMNKNPVTIIVQNSTDEDAKGPWIFAQLNLAENFRHKLIMDVRLRLLKTIYQPMADVGLKPDDLAQLYAHSEVRHFPSPVYNDEAYDVEDEEEVEVDEDSDIEVDAIVADDAAPLLAHYGLAALPWMVSLLAHGSDYGLVRKVSVAQKRAIVAANPDIFSFGVSTRRQKLEQPSSALLTDNVTHATWD
jgi:hypothetical protein